MEYDVIKASDMINLAYDNIEKYNESNEIVKNWRYVVESIKSNAKNGENLGINLADHSRVIDLKKGILLVEADHSAWIQTLKIYQKYIVTGLKRRLPELKIEGLVFRMKGSNAELHYGNKEELLKREKENLEKKYKEEEKFLENYEKKRKNSDKKSSTGKLPEEIQRIFDRLKNDMLTESK